MQERFDLINVLSKIHNAQSYLEIGVQNRGNNYDRVEIRRKVGVDPDPQALADFPMTSDAFFMQCEDKFDIIFIDGLHHADQVKKDFENSLMHLNSNGFIVLHDSLPDDEKFTHVPRDSKKWFGDVYRFIMILRSYPGIDYCVVRFDCGCTVVWKKSDFILKDNLKIPDHVIDTITWKYFEANKHLLPLVNANESEILRKIKGIVEIISEPVKIEVPLSELEVIPSALKLSERMNAQKPATQEQVLKLESKLDQILSLLGARKNFITVTEGASGTGNIQMSIEGESKNGLLDELGTKKESELSIDFVGMTGQKLDSFF